MKEHDFAQPSREFYTEGGKPHDPESVKMYEKLSLESSEQSPEFKALLGRLDFDAIKQLFLELARKTDIDPAQMNFVEPDRIVERNLNNASANFRMSMNAIEIDPAELKGLESEEISDPVLKLLEIVMHEEGHAVSKTKCSGKFTPDGFWPSSMRSGYSLDVFPRDPNLRHHTVFGLFDEGVTEKISRELGKKYLDSHPDIADPAQVQKMREYYDDDNQIKAYDLPVSFVEAFIAHVAHRAEVAEDLVWGAIIRGKLEGTDLDGSDFAVLFAEMFNDNFQEELSGMSSEKDESKLIQLMEMDKLKTIKPELWERINKRIIASAEYELEKNKAA